MITITITLEILASVESIFDTLIEVKRLDTGEVGLLLCSHSCKWPSSLINEATWLEGCYTPNSFIGDTRLLTGYHPNRPTGWVIDGNLLTFTVEEDEGVLGQPSLEFYSEETYLPEEKLLRRMWKSARTNREESAAMRVFYSQLYALVVEGKVRKSLLAAAWVVLPTDRWDYKYLVPADEAIPHCRKYADALVVTERGNGYYPAVEIISYNKWSRCWVISSNADIWGIPGYAAAVDAEPVEKKYCISEEQYCKSLLREEHGCITVTGNRVQSGYAVAENI